MNAFFYPSKRGINFAKIRGFKFTDYSAEEVADPRKPMRLQRGRPCRSAGVLRGVLPLRSARADPQKKDDHCGHPHTEKIN